MDILSEKKQNDEVRILRSQKPYVEPKPFEEWGLKMSPEDLPESRKGGTVVSQTGLLVKILEESDELFEGFKESEKF